MDSAANGQRGSRTAWQRLASDAGHRGQMSAVVPEPTVPELDVSPLVGDSPRGDVLVVGAVVVLVVAGVVAGAEVLGGGCVVGPPPSLGVAGGVVRGGVVRGGVVAGVVGGVVAGGVVRGGVGVGVRVGSGPELVLVLPAGGVVAGVDGEPARGGGAGVVVTIGRSSLMSRGWLS